MAHNGAYFAGGAAYLASNDTLVGDSVFSYNLARPSMMLAAARCPSAAVHCSACSDDCGGGGADWQAGLAAIFACVATLWVTWRICPPSLQY